MTQARKVLSNTVWQVGGKLTAALISIFVIKLITNYLDIGGYGQYTQIYEFMAYFAILSDLGLFTIAVREMAKDMEKVSFVLGNILSVRIIAATLALGIAVIAAFLIPKYAETRVAMGIAIAAAGIFLTIMHGTISSVLQVYYKMQYSAMSFVLGKIATFAYMLFTAYVLYPDNPEAGFPHLILAGVIGAAVMYLFTHFFVAKLSPMRLRFDFDFWKKVIIVSLPFGFALILNNVYLRINSLFIFFIRGDFEAGLYAVPIKMLEILGIIGLFFMNSVLPGLTQNMQKNLDRAGEVIQYSFDFLVMASVPIVAGVMTLAYPIVFLIAKKDYLSRLNDAVPFYGSDIALKIIVLALFFQFLIQLFSFILIASNHQNQLFWINGVGVSFQLLASYFSVSRFGFVGGAVSSVIVEMIVMILMWITAARKFRFRLNYSRTWRIFLAAAVMALSVNYLKDYVIGIIGGSGVLVLAALGAAVYAIMLMATKVVTKKMLRELLSVRN